MELDMVTDMDVDKVATMLANNKKKSPKCSKSCFMRSVPDLCLLRFASLFPPGCWSLERLQIDIIWLKIVSSYIPAWLHISSGNVVIFNRLWSVFCIAQLVCSLSSILLGSLMVFWKVQAITIFGHTPGMKVQHSNTLKINSSNGERSPTALKYLPILGRAINH